MTAKSKENTEGPSSQNQKIKPSTHGSSLKTDFNLMLEEKGHLQIRGKNARTMMDIGLAWKNWLTGVERTTNPATTVVNTNWTLKIPYTLRMNPHRSVFSSAPIPGYNTGVCPNPFSMSLSKPAWKSPTPISATFWRSTKQDPFTEI